MPAGGLWRGVGLRRSGWAGGQACGIKSSGASRGSAAGQRQQCNVCRRWPLAGARMLTGTMQSLGPATGACSRGGGTRDCGRETAAIWLAPQRQSANPPIACLPPASLPPDLAVSPALAAGSRCNDVADRNVAAQASRVPADSLFVSAITILELEIGVLLVLRRDPKRGALLRAWLDQSVLPVLSGRVTGGHRRGATVHSPACARPEIRM